MCLNRVHKKVYDRAAKAASPWEVATAPKDLVTCGNVRPVFNKTTHKFEFQEGYDNMYEAISSALMLYRLLCLFGGKVTVVPKKHQYKCIWWFTLKHKETGEYLQFGEWKGAAGIWTRFHSRDELPGSYKADILTLLNELISKNTPHPYDGTVAGSVA
jgi:hypothetical protein